MSSIIHKILKKHIKDPDTLAQVQAEIDKVTYFESNKLKKSIIVIESMTAEIDDYKKQLEANQEKIVQQSKLSTIGEVTATLSHEFNNQMMVLQGNISILNGFIDKIPNSEKLKKVLKKNEETLFAMSKLIKDIKKFSHQTDDSSLKLIEDSPSNLVKEAINICRNLLNNSNIQVKAENQIPEELKCLLPSSDLGQVFLNLIKNSYDFIQTDAVPNEQKWIKISSVVKDVNDAPHVIISFSNYGTIPEHVKAKLFSPFFTTKEVGKGTGIGLSLSKKTLESLGGRIYCTNIDNNIEFTLEIPILQNKEETIVLQNVA